MKTYLPLFISLIFIPYSLYSQDIGYAREVISTLCSDDLAGRGYVADGDAAAADYIKKQMENFNIQAFDYNYFQDFNFPVNTFPGKMDVFLDGKRLIPGKHFIVEPSSIGKSGDLKIMVLDSMGWDSLLAKPRRLYDFAGFSRFPVSKNKDFNERVKELAFSLFPVVL